MEYGVYNNSINYDIITYQALTDCLHNPIHVFSNDYWYNTSMFVGNHYNDVIIGAMASQISSFTIDYSTVYSGAYQRKHQCSVSLAFVRGIHRGSVNSPHKWPVTRKMFPFDASEVSSGKLAALSEHTRLAATLNEWKCDRGRHSKRNQSSLVDTCYAGLSTLEYKCQAFCAELHLEDIKMCLCSTIFEKYNYAF